MGSCVALFAGVALIAAAPAGAARSECSRTSDLCQQGEFKAGVHLIFVNNCPKDKPYVQRGDNSTVPKFNAVLEWPIVVGPIVARHTVPSKFGSRAVTTYTISLVMLSLNDQPRTYKVSWFCTSSKDDAWLVFG